MEGYLFTLKRNFTSILCIFVLFGLTFQVASGISGPSDHQLLTPNDSRSVESRSIAPRVYEFLEERQDHLVYGDELVSGFMRTAGLVSPEFGGTSAAYLPGDHVLVLEAMQAAKYLVGKGFSVTFSNIATPSREGQYFVGLHVLGTSALFNQVFSVKVNIVTIGEGQTEIRAWKAEGSPLLPKAIDFLASQIEFGPQLKTFGHVWPPPRPSYFHLSPNDAAINDMGATSSVEQVLKASTVRQVHGAAYPLTGAGIKVAVIDTGFNVSTHGYYSHYYNDLATNASGRLHLLSGSTKNPADDPVGHGTGVIANLVAIVPGASFYLIRATNMVEFDAALDKALAVGPHVLSFSVGTDEGCIPECFGQTLVDSIYNKILSLINNKGTFVAGSAGNSYWEVECRCVVIQRAWPSSIPQVADIGGSYWTGSSFKASNYATSFQSQVYPTRPYIPDLTGLVGLLVAPGSNFERDGIYIEMPTQDGSEYDVQLAAQDETGSTDGWLVASGTSSATPQVAGVGALLKQVTNGLATAAAIKQRLQVTALDITTGNSASGDPAGPGVDLATGYGLTDAWKAITLKQKLTVTVIDSRSGQYLEGSRVTATYFNGTVLGNSFADPNGKVIFTLPVGYYTVTASFSGCGSRSSTTWFLADKTMTIWLRCPFPPFGPVGGAIAETLDASRGVSHGMTSTPALAASDMSTLFSG